MFANKKGFLREKKLFKKKNKKKCFADFNKYQFKGYLLKRNAHKKPLRRLF
jgi:hypothetical protein